MRAGKGEGWAESRRTREAGDESMGGIDGVVAEDRDVKIQAVLSLGRRRWRSCWWSRRASKASRQALSLPPTISIYSTLPTLQLGISTDLIQNPTSHYVVSHGRRRVFLPSPHPLPNLHLPNRPLPARAERPPSRLHARYRIRYRNCYPSWSHWLFGQQRSCLAIFAPSPSRFLFLN
jgi:hypothetical protein